MTLDLSLGRIVLCHRGRTFSCGSRDRCLPETLITSPNDSRKTSSCMIFDRRLWSGHDGGRDMLVSLSEHVSCARIDVLDMPEEGNKITVRWLFSGKKDGRPVYLSAVAIYRFDGDRIA